MPGYFAQNMAELRELGVPKKQIHIIKPSSSQTSEENADEVRAKFREFAELGPEKIVVIAHSRGACDALAFAMANATFVKDRVEALFLIQGPFGGSGVAEYVAGKGVKMDRRMALRYRIMGGLLARLTRMAARRVGMDVVEGMTGEASRKFWAATMERYADAVATVGPKTFYVRSSIHPSHHRVGRKAIAWYLQIYHGPSDGMVALADQSLPGVGTVIATIEAGHADLTHRFPASRAPKEMRRALVQSIVMSVGRPGLDARPTAREGPASGSTTGGRLDLREDAVPQGQPGLKGDRRGELRVLPAGPVLATDR